MRRIKMKNNDEQNNKVPYMPIFMSIGISVGLAIGSAMGNISIGMCIGLCVGLCVGAGLDAQKRKGKNGAAEKDEDEKE